MRTTVLINNRNNGPYLRTCIDSVLNQSVAPDEVVVYDDGSTDDSVPLLRSYGSRLILMAEVHDDALPSRASQSKAVEKAFAQSSGDWIFLLDGDDFFHPQKIELVLQAVGNRSGVSMVQSPCVLVDETNRPFGQYRDARFHEPDFRQAIYRQNDVDFFYPTSALVVARSAMKAVLPMDMTVSPALACDTRISMCMPLLGEVISLEEPLTSWRRHSTSYLANLEHSRWFQAQQTYRRLQTFNSVAPRFGVPRLRLWKNRRFLRQIVGALLPTSLRQALRRGSVAPSTAGPGAKA